MDAVTPLLVAAVATGAFGLLVGSFLNVVVYRVPNGMSVVSPPSACPGCGSGIKSYDNVPVLSWLALRGKCRSCREPISARYPLVEAGVGVFFAVVAAWWWVV
ncbi:MAG: prepilin peptidase, partial [Mycetocola sp.]